MVVVKIDDCTIEYFRQQGEGGWPLSRQRHADLLDALDRAGVRAVGYDVLFVDPSTQDPMGDSVLEAMPAIDSLFLAYRAPAFTTLPADTADAARWADSLLASMTQLEKIGMPAEIALRHRPTQFGHIFSGDHYASGYYSYMWSEVMDADAFGAFEEAGDIFDPATAKRLHDDIYSSGGSREPEEAYVAFRGREPEADALLRRRGLLQTPEAA